MPLPDQYLFTIFSIFCCYSSGQVWRRSKRSDEADKPYSSGDLFMRDRVRTIIGSMNLLPVPIDGLSDQDSLFDAGMTSFGSVQLMLAVEEAFDIEFPNSLLTRKTFATVGGLTAAVEQLATVKV
jgi:acyl carrier protein